MAKGGRVTRAVLYLGLGLGVLVILFILGLFASRAPFPYDTDSVAPDGTKALYLLLKQQGANGVSSVTTLVPQGRGLMIMLEPRGGFGREEWRQVVAWVEQGNTLLLSSDHSADIYGCLHYELIYPGTAGKRGSADSDRSSVYVRSDNPLLKDVRELTLTGQARLQKHPDMTFSYGDEHGIYLAECRKGRGRIILLTTPPDLFTNKNISQHDNLILFLNIVRLYGREGIWFSAFSPEILPRSSESQPSAEGFPWEMISWPWRLVAIQCALVVLCLFYSWGKRFGRSVPLPKQVDQVAGDYVSCLANIYRQARARPLILDSIYQGFKQELARNLGVSPQLSDVELVKIYSVRRRVDAEQLDHLLARCLGLLARQDLREAELLAMARAIAMWQDSNLSFSGKRSGLHHD